MPTGDGYSLHLSRMMASRIVHLPAAITWLTTWRTMANTQIGSWLGWPTLDVLEPLKEPASLTWKLESLLARLDGSDEPFVWIDDHLESIEEDIGDAFRGRQHLLVCPDPSVGLSPQELDQVESFLADLGAV
jgi:hypothetical protein